LQAELSKKVESIGFDRLFNIDAVHEFNMGKRTFENLPNMIVELYLKGDFDFTMNGLIIFHMITTLFVFLLLRMRGILGIETFISLMNKCCYITKTVTQERSYSCMAVFICFRFEGVTKNLLCFINPYVNSHKKRVFWYILST
jgi:hypothetical protein